MEEPDNKRVIVIDPLGLAEVTGGNEGYGERLPCPTCGYMYACKCKTTHDCLHWMNGKRCRNRVAFDKNYCEEHSIDYGHSTYAQLTIPPYEFQHYTSIEDLFDGEDCSDGALDFYPMHSHPHYRRVQRRYNNVDSIHFRVKVNGKRDDIDMYHSIIHAIDQDYPLNPLRKTTDQLAFCTKCKGLVWKQALLQPEQLKKAAKQAGVKIKIVLYTEEKKCANKTYVMQAV